MSDCGLRAEAIAVLGCTVRPNGDPSAALLRRVQLATRAYQAGVAPWIIASGGRRWGSWTEAVVIRNLLVGCGVPAPAITMELCSLTTLENGIYCAELLRKRGAARRAVVATCRWHLPRALADFRLCGIDALAPPDDWLCSPPPTLMLRLREHFCGWLDAAKAAARPLAP